jgi:long-chain acyl-CoA synthetase
MSSHSDKAPALVPIGERIERLRRFGRRNAYLWRDGVRWRHRTYAELHAGIVAVAATLRAQGLKPKEPVLVQGPDEPDWVEGLLGTFLAGGVGVPLEAGTADAFRDKIAATVGARLILAPASIAPPPGVKRIDFGAWSNAAAGAASGRSADAAGAPFPGAPMSDTAEIVFTSGTTGEPKGVVLTHENLAADFAPLEEVFRRYERLVVPLGEFRVLSTLPLSHMFGQAMNVFLSLYMGLTVVLVAPRPRDVLDAAPRVRAWGLFSVPRLLEILTSELRREAGDAEAQARLDARLEQHAGKAFWLQRLLFRRARKSLGWRFTVVVSGGAALADPVREFYERVGVLVVQGYGLTETAPIVSISNPFKRGSGDVGRALKGQEVRLGPDGEIQVRGRNVTSGYFGQEGGGEWLGTGDVGEIDAHGRIVIKGRIKDVIVTPEGENVYATDVETAFQGIAGVRDAAVFGLPHATGEQVHAALILAPGIDAAAIVAEANGRLLPKQRVRDWTVWTEGDFPRTSTGKVKRAALKTQVALGKQEGPKGAPTPTAAGGVRRIIARIARVSPDRLQDATRLVEDLGLASLDLVEVAAALEEEFGLTVAEDRMASATVGDLEEQARAALGGAAAGRAAAAPAAAPAAASAPAAAPQPATARGASPDPAPREARDGAVAPGNGAASWSAKVVRGALRMPRWSRSWPFHFNRRLVEEGLQRPIVHIWGRPEVRGLERLQEAPAPYLFVANHHSYFDTALLRSTLPAGLRGRIAPAMTTRYHRVWFGEVPGTRGRYLLEGLQASLTEFFFNAFPLPETAGFRRSLVYAGELLDAGFSVLIFPEGRHVPEGTMERFRGGIGVFARDLRAPVVPVHVTGTHYVLPDERYWPMFYATTITYGKPLRFAADADPTEVTGRLEAAVRDLAGGRVKPPEPAARA